VRTQTHWCAPKRRREQARLDTLPGTTMTVAKIIAYDRRAAARRRRVTLRAGAPPQKTAPCR
jgi:hypothetical protein